MLSIEYYGGVTMSAISRQFIIRCRAKGRISMKEAMRIAEEMGLFESENPDIVLERDRKQQIRLLLSRVTYDGERAIRSIRVGDDSLFVDLTNAVNTLELNHLIENEYKKIKRAQDIIRSLKKLRALDGQLKLKGGKNNTQKPKQEVNTDAQMKLDDYFSDAL